MKILMDVKTRSKCPHFGDSTDILSTSSKDIHVLSNDEDDAAQVRAEYLYSLCADNNIHIAVIEDVDVANNLSQMGIDTVHVI